MTIAKDTLPALAHAWPSVGKSQGADVLLVAPATELSMHREQLIDPKGAGCLAHSFQLRSLLGCLQSHCPSASLVRQGISQHSGRLVAYLLLQTLWDPCKYLASSSGLHLQAVPTTTVLNTA